MDSSFVDITHSLVRRCTPTTVTACDRRLIPSIVPLLNTHRRLLREQMSEIVAEKNEFEHTLDELVPNPQLHPLIKQINQWENESIDQTHRRAEKLRQQLLEPTLSHRRELSQTLQELSEQLIDAQKEDVYIETDLRRWKKNLDVLKANLISPSTIAINEYLSNPLVPDIYVVSTVTNELFLQTFDNKIQIEENGQLVIHDTSIDTSEVRGKNVYETGCHKIRLRIEQSTNKWTFLGVNSKSTPLQNQSNACLSSYGWSSNRHVWSEGQSRSSVPDKSIDMRNNDVISLIFDCDQSMIMMINERSKVKHELPVNIQSCPLPWQLHAVLHEPYSRIRILRE